jgi:hypothetical protein
MFWSIVPLSRPGPANYECQSRLFPAPSYFCSVQLQTVLSWLRPFFYQTHVGPMQYLKSLKIKKIQTLYNTNISFIP